MARTTTTYTQGPGQRYMDVLISPDTLLDGTLIQRLNVRKYPRLGVITTVNSTIALVVTPGGTQTSLTTLTLTATMSESEEDDQATGLVVFKDGGSVLASVPLNTHRVAVFTTTLAPGSHSLTAVYAGDNSYGTSTSSAVVRTSVAPPSTLTGASPATGVAAGSTAVTLTGTYLTGATGVTFGGVAATSVVVVNDTTITCVTPAHATGAVNVVAVNATGNGTLTNGFTYV